MSRRPADTRFLVVAEGQGVAIRLKRLEDARDDHAWSQDAELARLNHRPVSDESFTQYQARLEQELRFVSPRERTFAIINENGWQIGNVMYYNVPATGDSAEVGITIGYQNHRDRGLGRRAMVAFIRFLFETTAFRTLTLHTLESNERAIKCFQACGFETVGCTEQRGAGLVRMTVRREYWLMYDAEGRFGFTGARPEGNVHVTATNPSPTRPSVTG